MDPKNKGRSTAGTTIVILIVLILLVGAGYIYYRSGSNGTPAGTTPSSTADQNLPGSSTSTASSSLPLPVTYTNNTYGFTFSLPADWQGYAIVKNEWQGFSSTNGNVIATGTALLIRNPQWTASNHYEDIPVMIFTLAQWSSYQSGVFSTSPAPFPASELGQNNTYVFALPPRWDYDYSTGYQEADTIMSENPLQAFNL